MSTCQKSLDLQVTKLDLKPDESDSKTHSLYVQSCHMKEQKLLTVLRPQRVALSWAVSPLIQDQIAGCELNFVEAVSVYLHTRQDC